jgi:hypothetical protein
MSTVMPASSERSINDDKQKEETPTLQHLPEVRKEKK